MYSRCINQDAQLSQCHFVLFLVKPGPWVYKAVGGANIQIVHYFDHGYLEEEKLMIHSFSYFWSKIFDRHGH